MSIKLAALAHMIDGLSPDERAEFRRWYARYESEAERRRIAAGSPSGAPLPDAGETRATVAAGIPTSR